MFEGSKDKIQIFMHQELTPKSDRGLTELESLYLLGDRL